MKFTGLRRFAAISVVLATSISLANFRARGANSPKRGGTLRVEFSVVDVLLDPRGWKEGTAEFATNEKLGALVFDRLVTLDSYGRFQPELAVEWLHDTVFKRWQFFLRAGVKFSDGSELSSADVVAALEPLLPGGQQISAAGNSVVIQSNAAMPDLLEELASGRYFVYRVERDGILLGTGPFFAASAAGRPKESANPETDPTETWTRGLKKPVRLMFRANDTTWSGRPFLDAVEVSLGVPPLQQLFDLQLGKAELVEVPPELVLRAKQQNIRLWTTVPTILYGLLFDEAQPTEARLREAVSLSLDRQTMANVLLQKQAEPASALLPQWLSGYAFLFTMETNPERAKEIRTGPVAGTPAAGDSLRLRVDPPGDLAKLLGERVAVNARQAAILVHVVSRSSSRNVTASSAASGDLTATAHLFEWHYSTLSPRLELDSFVSSFNLGSPKESDVSSTDPEQLYAREKKLLEDRRVLPLVAIPEYAGLASNVRDWMPEPWGQWNLADVWLQAPEPSAAPAPNYRPMGTPVSPPAAFSTGAKP